jgi:hypothetical protein
MWKEIAQYSWKLVVIQLVKKFSVFYGTRRFVTGSQGPATCPYIESNESRPHSAILFNIHFILTCNLPGLPISCKVSLSIFGLKIFSLHTFTSKFKRINNLCKIWGADYEKCRLLGVFYMGHTAATCLGWFLACGFFYPEDGSNMFPRNVG